MNQQAKDQPLARWPAWRATSRGWPRPGSGGQIALVGYMRRDLVDGRPVLVTAAARECSGCGLAPKRVSRAVLWAVVVAIGLLSNVGPAVGGSPSLPLRKVADVALGGRSPRFDYQTIDPVARRLYVADQGDGAILVVDLVHRRILGRISGLPNVHGVLVVPAVHRLFATAQGLHQLAMIDTRTDRVLSRTPAGVVPDGIAYDPVGRHVFVSDERPAGALIVVDATTGRAAGTISLSGSAGNVQYDPVAKRVLVGVETRDGSRLSTQRRCGSPAVSRSQAATPTTVWASTLRLGC